MSKFRARALDSTRALPIYRSEDIPDLAEYVAVNRSVSQMPTGMEKEEETERHLRDAIEARQYYGSHSASFIPIPNVTRNIPTHAKYYRQDIATPHGLIRMSGLGTEEEQPDYDMDSQDEEWLKAQSKDRPISPSQFESMMDKLEKGSGNTVLTEAEAQGLIKGNPDLVVAVYDYWLSKRLKSGHSLNPAIKTDRRDGSTGNNPYIAFRKRMEKMQTRKNRKNDEVAYMYMVKLQRELLRVCTLGKQIREREERKNEMAKMDLKIFLKRYELNDWSGSVYSQLLQEHSKEPLSAKSYASKQAQVTEDEWSPNKHKEWDSELGQIARHDGLFKKRKKRKHKLSLPSSSSAEKQVTELKDPKLPQDDSESLLEKSEDELPDGIFTFQRRPYVKYYQNHSGSPDTFGQKVYSRLPNAKRFKFAETELRGHFHGLARRRFGRGQRLIWDWVPFKSESETSEMDSSMPALHSLVSELQLEDSGMLDASALSQDLNSSCDLTLDSHWNEGNSGGSGDRYHSRSPSPSLPAPAYLPPSLLHVRDTVALPPTRHKPPASAFLTTLPSDQNSPSLSTFMGRPSSCFHLHETAPSASVVPATKLLPPQKQILPTTGQAATVGSKDSSLSLQQHQQQQQQHSQAPLVPLASQGHVTSSSSGTQQPTTAEGEARLKDHPSDNSNHHHQQQQGVGSSSATAASSAMEVGGGGGDSMTPTTTNGSSGGVSGLSDSTGQPTAQSPSSLTMKIRIEKHFPSAGDSKKVAFVVTPSKMQPDRMDESCADKQSWLYIMSLEGPVSAVYDMNRHTAPPHGASKEAPVNRHQHCLFGLPKRDLPLPSLFSGLSKTQSQGHVTQAPPPAVGMRLAQLKGIDLHHPSYHHSSVPVAASAPLPGSTASSTTATTTPEETRAHHLSKGVGALMSSLPSGHSLVAVPGSHNSTPSFHNTPPSLAYSSQSVTSTAATTTAAAIGSTLVSSSPTVAAVSPLNTVNASHLQQSSFASSLHSSGLLQNSKRPGIPAVVDNGMDTSSQMKQVLVGHTTKT